MDVHERLDDYGKPYFEVKSDKFNCTFIVKKSNDGYSFYEITQTNGTTAEVLKGWFSSSKKALQVLAHYIELAKTSTTVQRDRKTKIREQHRKKNASAAKSNSKEHVQQGTPD